MLETDAENNLIFEMKKMQFSRNVVTPAGQPYAVADPKLEAPRGFFSFENGMGFREEDPSADRDTAGYYYALYADCDGTSFVNGPLITTVTPTQTGGIRQFFEMVSGGTRRLCALASRYCLVRTADSAAGWGLGQDFGVGAVSDRVAVFRGTQGADNAYVAMGTGTNYWHWSGASNTTTWTQHASEAVISFVTDVDKVWALSRRTGGANNGYILRNFFDGGTAPTLGGGFVVTELSNPAVDMAMFNDRLYIATERGLFAPSVETMEDLAFQADYLTPAFAYQRNADNGRGLTPWFEWLIVPMAGSLFRYGADGSFPEFGLGALPDNRSEVQGICTAAAGYRNWTLFATFYNAVEDASYLMRWGNWNWINTNEGPKRVFVPGWNGALAKFSGVQINALFISEVSGGPRLWLGDDDGNIHYITLPRYSMSWLSDTASRYNTSNPGQVYFPDIYHGIRFEPKANLAIAATSENLDTSAQYVDVTYRLLATGAFGGAANIDGSGRFTVSPGQRRNFTVGVSSRMIGLLATLTTTDNTTPAVLKSIAVYQCVRPTWKWIFNFAVRMGQNVINRVAGRVGRFFGEAEQRSSLEDSGTSASPVTFITPQGASYSVLVTDVMFKAKNRRNANEPLEWTAYIEAMQHDALDLFGTWDSVSRYTWSYVANYSWGQIGNI